MGCQIGIPQDYKNIIVQYLRFYLSYPVQQWSQQHSYAYKDGLTPLEKEVFFNFRLPF